MRSTSPKNEFVTDTMGLVVFLEDRRLPARLREIYASAATGKTTIHVPAMVLAEILYLAEKKRIELSLEDVAAILNRSNGFVESPLDWSVIETAIQLREIPELHDRLIAATAVKLGLPLLTNDPAIQQSRQVESIW